MGYGGKKKGGGEGRGGVFGLGLNRNPIFGELQGNM